MNKRVIDINKIREEKKLHAVEAEMKNVYNNIHDLRTKHNYLLIDREYPNDGSELFISDNSDMDTFGREFYFNSNNERKVGLVLINSEKSIFNNIVIPNISDRILAVDHWDNDSILILYSEITDIEEDGSKEFKFIIDKKINYNKFKCGECVLDDIPDYLYSTIMYILTYKF